MGGNFCDLKRGHVVLLLNVKEKGVETASTVGAEDRLNSIVQIDSLDSKTFYT